MRKQMDTVLGKEFGKIKRSDLYVWIIIGILALYLGYVISNCFINGEFSIYRLENVDALFVHPIQLRPNGQTPICMMAAGVIWLMAFVMWYDRVSKKYMDGQEYGTARWGNIREFNEALTTNCKRGKIENKGNRILSKNLRVAYDTRITERNNNMVVIGGSGAGKTAFLLAPNLLNLYGSNVYTDPKGSLIKDYGNYLEANGVTVQVLNLNDMEQSMRYNPFVFIRDQTDLDMMATNIFMNTAPENAGNSSDPFWDDAAIMLLKALMFYIWLECPRIEVEEHVISYKDGPLDIDTGLYKQIPDETEKIYLRLGQDFSTLLKLADECEVSGDDSPSAMDRRMEELEKENPKGSQHPAVIWYRRCMKGAPDTKRSILAVLYARISRFDNPKLLRILSGNDLELDKMGTEKRIALFIVVPETDDTYNFLPGILYTQMFQQHFDAAKRTEDNRLPIPVGYWFDEFVNIPMPRNFEKIQATVRSYNMYMVIFLQSKSQLETKYKDNAWQGVIGNCDTMVYLGGNEETSFEYVAKMLGKFTIDKRSSGETRGSNASSSLNYDRLGRQFEPDEIRMLPNSKEIVLYRSYYPLIDDKLKCWEMQEYADAMKYGKYETVLQNEEMDTAGLFEGCKGKIPEINTVQVDMLDFLKADLYSAGWDTLAPEKIAGEMQNKEFQDAAEKAIESAKREERKLKELEDQAARREANIEAYEKAEGLVSYILSEHVTELQKKYYRMGVEKGFAQLDIMKIINPRFSDMEMRNAFDLILLLYR